MIQALQYDNTPNQLAHALATQQDADYRQQQQFYYDQYKQKLELMNAITPEVLNRNFDGEVVNNGIADLRKNVYAWLKQNPTARPEQLQAVLQGQLGKISEWSNKVKAIKTGMDEYFKEYKDDGRNINNWKNAALTQALYKDVNGQRVLRDESELDPSYIQNYAKEAWDNHGTAFLKGTDIENNFTKVSKEIATQVSNISKSVGATVSKDGYSSRDKVEIPTYMQWDPKTRTASIRKDADGLMAEDVYAQFISQDSAADKYVEQKAYEAMRAGDPRYLISSGGKNKIPVDIEVAKRIWMGDRLEKNAKISVTDDDKVLQSKSDTHIYNTTNVGSDKEVPTIDVAGSIRNTYDKYRRPRELKYYDADVQSGLMDFIKKNNPNVADYVGVNNVAIGIPKNASKPVFYVTEDIKDKNDNVIKKKGDWFGWVDDKLNIGGSKLMLGTKSAQEEKKNQDKQSGASNL